MSLENTEPLCARIEGTKRDVFEGKYDRLPRLVLFLRGLVKSSEWGRDFWGFFRDGQLEASTAMNRVTKRCRLCRQISLKDLRIRFCTSRAAYGNAR